MKSRIITGIFIALVFVGVILGTLLVDSVFFDILIVLLAVGATYELWHCLSTNRRLYELFLCLASIIACYCFFVFLENQIEILGYCFLTLVTVFLIACVICMFLGENFDSLKSLAVILVYPIGILMCIMSITYTSIPGVIGSVILLLFLVSSFTDVFAYFGGSLIGGKKLCPSISPKKTIAGAVSGLFGGLVAAATVIMFAFVPAFSFLNIEIFGGTSAYIINIVVMGFLGSICTQIGDLIASYIKRRVGIKDFGKLLPGHGGIMDRIDGMMVNGFFLFVYTALLRLIV